MSLATITLRDTPDGSIDFGLVFEGAFQPDSFAHQQANRIREFMDFQAKECGQTVQPRPEPANPLLIAPYTEPESKRAAAMQHLHEMAELANRPISDRIQIVQ